jgi:hypothetical protein
VVLSVTYADTQGQMQEIRSELPNLPLSTPRLTRVIDENGWARLSQGELLLWLPTESRLIDDSLLHMSAMELPDNTLLGSSKFVHGKSWKLVAGS